MEDAPCACIECAAIDATSMGCIRLDDYPFICCTRVASQIPPNTPIYHLAVWAAADVDTARTININNYAGAADLFEMVTGYLEKHPKKRIGYDGGGGYMYSSHFHAAVVERDECSRMRRWQ